MGYDLSRNTDNEAAQEFHWGAFSWIAIIELAIDAGFRPDKYPTTLKKYAQWNGNWSSNDGQTVSTEAANAFASALESALKTRPQWSDEARRQKTQEFIAWLRFGAFEIW